MIDQQKLKRNYPIVKQNKQGHRIYNPDFVKYFNNLNPINYIDLAQKLADKQSKIFRHIYLEQSPEQYIDIMQNGALSCAVFVSQVLLYFGYIKQSNAKVTSLEENLSSYGRKKVAFDQNKDMITSIPIGAIIVWANQIKKTNKETNKEIDFFVSDHHIGFYKGNSKAISNVVNNKTKNIKTIAEHNAIRDAPKLDHYDKIEIVKYYILDN